MQPSFIDIKKAVEKSQHCQRNYDLEQHIPQEDIDLLVHAATRCPSKQNIAFYKLHVLTDRDQIEQLHKFTTGTHTYDSEGNQIASTNSQVLANAVFVFEQLELDSLSDKSKARWEDKDEADYQVFLRDRNTAIGIASGYINLTAAMLGYSSGCCQCFETENIQEFLGLENRPAMIQGVGFKDATRQRREHHETGFMFPTNKKEEIQVTYR